MIEQKDYNYKSVAALDAEWLPHRGVSDYWLIQARLYDAALPLAEYMLDISLHKQFAGLGSYFELYCGLGDIIGGIRHQARRYFSWPAAENGGIAIDAESILCGETLQLLDDGKAMALLLDTGEARLQLRLDKADEVLLGGKCRIELDGQRLGDQRLLGAASVNMPCAGRLRLGDKELRLTGAGAFIRSYGRMPLQQARFHWECFRLYLDDGRKYIFYEFPYAGHRAGIYIDKRNQPQRCDDFSVEYTDYTEIDEWRFAHTWYLKCDSHFPRQLYFLPLLKDQATLPTTHVMLGVYNYNAQRMGYAFAEAMPGARNELKKIPLKLYRDY
ncbi:MAG: hypothetical protein Q4B96_00660 [Bacillota bacterium]|nr:hypothetical protein [Bacillota bacterium]